MFYITTHSRNSFFCLRLPLSLIIISFFFPARIPSFIIFLCLPLSLSLSPSFPPLSPLSLSLSLFLISLCFFLSLFLVLSLSLSLSLSFSLSLCQVSGETQVVAKVTYQNLFRLFPRLSGMTGK